ncbi:MAG: DUF1254 domain-containing protein [Minicystis sp.]
MTRETKDLPLTPARARHLARVGFIYGYSMVENYRMMYQNFIAADPPQELNQLYREKKLATPEMPVVTPNNDTLYTQAWLDLRAEPYVLSVPAIPQEQYYSFQNVDYFTNNFAYIGTREQQFAAADYLLAGPGWQGTTPAGVAEVVRSPSHLFYLLGRTQVLNGNLDQANAVQDQYRLTPLSVYTRQPAPPPAPPLSLPPISADSMLTLQFFEYLNMCLTQFQGPQQAKADRWVMALLEPLDVGPGKTFDPSAFSAEIRAAMVEGIQGANDALTKLLTAPSPEVWVAPNPDEVFGTTWGDYWLRAFIAKGYIYMNSPAEAMYPLAHVDAFHEPLTGEKRYTMRFEEGGLPPAEAFWSVTIYQSSNMGLVPNAIDRYSLGSSSDLAKGADGSITFYFQQEAPTAPEEYQNWLPAPAGEFYLVLRVYIPEEVMLEGDYKVPELIPDMR